MKAQGIALGFDSRIVVKAPTGRPYSMRIVHSIWCRGIRWQREFRTRATM